MSLYDELLDEINKKVTQNREEYESSQNKKTKSNSRRKAYNSAESTKLINNNVLPTRKQYTPNEHSHNINDLPVANEFRRQLEIGKRVEPQEESSLPVFIKKASDYLLPTPQKGVWIAKKIGTGIAQGTAGIGQSITTEVANNFKKGNEKSGNDLLKDIANSMTLNPIQNAGDMLQTLSSSIDPTKSWWENVASFGTNLVSGTMNQLPIKKQLNTLNQVVGKILPNNASDTVMAMNNAISKPLENLNQKLYEEGQQYDPITQTLGSTGQVVGNMAPAIATTAITKNPTAGLAAMGISAKGQATQEALNKGATLDQAIKIGDTKGAIEIGTEMLTGGVNIFGKGALDKIVERGINKRIKNEVVNFFVKKGVDFSGEVVEEVISDLLGTVIDKGTVDPEAKYTWEDFGDTAITTILSTMVLNVIGGGYTPKAYKENAQDILQTKKNNQNSQMVQNGNVEQVGPIANDQQTLYNNIESESGINGEIYSRTIGRDGRIENEIADQRGQTSDTTISQGDILEKFKENKQRSYEEFIEYANNNKIELDTVETEKLKQLANNLGINVTLFNGDGTNNYLGMTDKQNPNNVYIDINQKEIRGEDLLYHEFLHSRKRNNDSIYIDKIGPIEQDIVKNYNDIINNFIEEKGLDERYKNYPELIAEEIIADYTSKNLGNLEVDYNLPQFYIEAINEAVNEMTNNVKTNNTIKDIEITAPIAENLGSFSSQKNNKSIDFVSNDTNILPDTKKYLTDKRTKDKVSIKEVTDTFAQKLVNKGHYIDKLADKTGNQELKYKYDRTMNAFNEAQISIGERQIDSRGNVVGKSLLEVFKPSKDAKLSTEFQDYLANKHNISRDLVGKNIYGGEVTAPQSSQIVQQYEAKYPQFKEWAKDVSTYNDNNLQDLVKSGMVSRATYNNLKEMYGDYVPIYRDIVQTMQEFEDDRVGTNTLKRATQSGKQILSIEESMAEQTLSIKKAIRINEVGIELARTLGKDSIIESGINYDPIAIETLNGDVIEKATDGTNIFTIFQNGEMSHFKISDDIYSAFSKNTLQNKINNSKVAKALLTPVEKLSKIQRNLLTTYSIGFAFNNPIKDIQDAYFNTKYNSATFSKNYIKSLYNITTNGDWYQSYVNNGGTANTYFDYSKGLLPSNRNIAQRFVDKVKYVNEVLEQAPRLAEYISTIEHNGTISEALYNAADITTNFKRGGDITKVANKYGANFLNASVQGLDKLYRNITGQNGIKGYANVLVKATLLQVAPAILNGILLKDDKEYEDLPEYTKDNYYLIKMNDGKFFRIPKGRVSSVVGGIARRILETGEGKEVDWKSIVDTTINQLAPNNPLTDNILAPIVQARNNKAWYGGDIVSSRLQKLPTAEQYDEKTDSLSKFLGEKLNISPKKINYVLDQYSGGIGDIILPMMTPQAENNILEDKFTTDSIMKNKSVSKYYETVEELEKLKNSIKATDEDKLKYKYMTEISQDLSDLYNKKRETQNSTMKDEEKKKAVRNIQKQINSMVEERLENKESLKINGDVSKIGGSSYYKVTNTKTKQKEWNKVTEKEQTKNVNISLSTYASYKEKIAQETIKQRKSGTIKEDGSIKEKDKINILINSNYNQKEKQELYENYILSSTDKKYEIIKSTGLNINTYLKYKLANSNEEFSADKKDDGTVKGKSITNSAKDKRYNYIKNMDATYMQKAVLFGLEASPSKTDKATIVNYISSLEGKTNKEKLDMLSRFSWITIYKNGTFDF